MWTRLTQEYAQVAVANSNKLTASLFQYNMNPDHAVMAYINRMRQMAEELRCVNAEVTDQQLIARILQTLSPSYRYFLSAWDSVPVTDQTITNSTARLLIE